ncbi:MAG TPA: preprotein translocase subunit YajC [Nocardioides sp.]|uniref:preprotein translocase subunit YajC n=1 Tax=Nocardioides sp. TaxID=35761 RepID=UPI002ED9E87C
MSDLGAILPLVLIVLVFWFLLIRPQQRRARELQQMQSALKPGDEVMLTSGLFGTIEQITDEYLLVEVATGVTVKVVRGAIGRVVPKPEPEGDISAPGSEEN